MHDVPHIHPFTQHMSFTPLSVLLQALRSSAIKIALLGFKTNPVAGLIMRSDKHRSREILSWAHTKVLFMQCRHLPQVCCHSRVQIIHLCTLQHRLLLRAWSLINRRGEFHFRRGSDNLHVFPCPLLITDCFIAEPGSHAVLKERQDMLSLLFS